MTITSPLYAHIGKKNLYAVKIHVLGCVQISYKFPGK